VSIPLREYWQLLSRYLRPQRRSVLVLAAALLCSIGLQVYNPQIMRRFIDTAQAGGATETLVRSGVLFMIIALVQQALAVLATYLGESVGWAATNELRAEVAEHCLRLDLSFHNAHTPGEMIERLDGDVTTLSNFFSQFVVQLLGAALLLVGVLAALLREDWRIGAAMALFSVITLLVLMQLRNIAVPHWKAERQASADQIGFLEERLAGTEDIRANGAKAYVMRRFYELMRVVMQRSLKAGLMVNVMVNASWVLFSIANALAIVIGAYLFRAHVLTIGAVYLVFNYTNMLIRPIDRITWQLQDLQRAGAGIGRVKELFGLSSRLGESGDQRLPAGPLQVEFRDVTFGYDDAPQETLKVSETFRVLPREIVLREVSFRLESGKVLGLLGRTGSGKTTLTRLLFRLYDPDAGAIYLGDHAGLTDLRQVQLSNLRGRVGMVTQNIQLFQASVRDNLTFFDPGIPDERILEVLRELGMGEWYESLAQGLDSELASGGGGLSAGQAQLLAFVRIFLQDPGLVILDEASSRLDPATEALIERAVDKLVQGRTAIIIAHRLGTVERADEIMILEEGQVIEHGARAGLARDPASRFHHLLQTGLEEVLA
jgi:ABC-type multidrug transport system fused ATPase/permease subunit